MLLRIACVKKLMTQLKEEMEDGHFSSAKEIDDYQKLKKKNFLDLSRNETLYWIYAGFLFV